MTETVRATQAAVVHVDGIVESVKQGQPFSVGDRIVELHPWLFKSDVEMDAALVEATAEPGAKRATARR